VRVREHAGVQKLDRYGPTGASCRASEHDPEGACAEDAFEQEFAQIVGTWNCGADYGMC
jgi:hypothetical protein